MCYHVVCHAWKAMRRQLFDGRVDAARLSAEAITSLIDDANEARLVKWKASVRSRGGAARWIASKMKLRRSPPLPSFDSAVFSASQLARKLAKEFADRWNVGCYTLKRGSSCFVGVGSSPPLACHPIIQPPPPLRPSRIDLSLFDHVPAYEPPGTWSPEDVLRHAPDGAPGLEGHSAEWFQQLHLDSLSRLARLYDMADKGYIPAFWSRARVTLIPKGDDAPVDDRRPITVLPITY